MLFDSWHGLVRVVSVGAAAYAALVLMLRISGNRTLSKLNAFDLVVTVALGSTLATVLLSKDVALAEGMLAFAVLIGLQFLVSWFAVRSASWRKAIKSEPVLLLHDGQLLHRAMRSARVSEDEILSALRTQGLSAPAAAAAVVLECDGSLSVLAAGNGAPERLVAETTTIPQ